ncbi:MAG TPA: hypothetical protein VFO86_13085, partial [Terriglobia bacterium]|nr:hypothetical protein [Terriglobia bacterium]
KELRLIYGKDIAISRKGSFVLVHLDHPAAELIRERTEEFDPETFFCDYCPLCQMVKDSGVLIFNDAIYEEDEIMED